MLLSLSLVGQPTVAREVQTPLGPAVVQSIDDTQPVMVSNPPRFSDPSPP
jgi:hypothetical protein